MPKRKDAKSTAETKIEWVATENLLFDPENPRLVEQLEERAANQAELLRILWQHMAVDELAMSIAASGYFEYEPLFVIPHQSKFHVIEGNRRLAAVKLLLDESERKRLRATDLPKISAERAAELTRLPVIKTTRKNAWQYLGFKHVNGPAKWDSYAKAQYVASVHRDYKIPLADIARQIGDKHWTVQRFYRALMVLQQAEKAKVFSRENRSKGHFSFSHLYTGLDYEGISNFVSITDKASESETPVPKKNLKQLGELLVWMYGDETREISAVVQSQNPDLRHLDEVLQNPTATEALRAGLPLNVALEVSYGDEFVFTKSLHQAKESLQKAHGTLSTGYSGDLDLLKLADSLLNLSTDLVEDMERKRKRPRSRRRSS